jgi:hypothetical protein
MGRGVSCTTSLVEVTLLNRLHLGSINMLVARIKPGSNDLRKLTRLTLGHRCWIQLTRFIKMLTTIPMLATA